MEKTITESAQKLTAKCSKCKKEDARVMISSVSYCKACFQENCLHKFKTTLRTRLRVWKDDLCLVCAGSDLCSLCLLRLLDQSLHEHYRKKVFLALAAIHVDESAVYPSASSDSILKECAAAGIPHFVVPIEYVFDIEPSAFALANSATETAVTVVKRLNKSERKERDSKGPEAKEQAKAVPECLRDKVIVASPEAKGKLRALIDSVPVQHKYEIVTYLRRWLVLYFATKYGFTKVPELSRKNG